MEFQDKVNTVLIPMTHYFAAFRMPELAIVNVLALVTMNIPTQNDKHYLLVNGICTYLMGYAYFLEQKPSSGVYMFLLGMLCMGTSITSHLQSMLKDWNSSLRVQQEEQVEQVEQEQEQEQEEEEPPTLEQEEPPTLEQEELSDSDSDSDSESEEDHTKTE